jgi:hypothetical protein
MFSGSEHLTVASPGFINTRYYVNTPSAAPPEYWTHFRRIPLGDINLQHNIRLDSDPSVVTRHNERSYLRPIYIAKRVGSKSGRDHAEVCFIMFLPISSNRPVQRLRMIVEHARYLNEIPFPSDLFLAIYKFKGSGTEEVRSTILLSISSTNRPVQSLRAVMERYLASTRYLNVPSYVPSMIIYPTIVTNGTFPELL